MIVSRIHSFLGYMDYVSAESIEETEGTVSPILLPHLFSIPLHNTLKTRK